MCLSWPEIPRACESAFSFVGITIKHHTHHHEMSFFSSPPPSYAQEQLQAHLGQLTTLPVVVPVAALETTTDVVPSRASDRLQHALAQLTAGKPPSLDKLADILDSVQRADDEVEVSEITVLDREAQAEVVTRAVSLIWAHTMQTFVDGALQLEDDRAWWDYAISSRTGTVVYLVQSRSGSVTARMLTLRSPAIPSLPRGGGQDPAGYIYGKAPLAALALSRLAIQVASRRQRVHLAAGHEVCVAVATHAPRDAHQHWHPHKGP